MCGFIAQLVEHRTGIVEVTGSNPVEALIFFRLLHSNCLNWKFTAKITYHLHIYPQFIYESFHILHIKSYSLIPKTFAGFIVLRNKRFPLFIVCQRKLLKMALAKILSFCMCHFKKRRQNQRNEVQDSV